LWERNNSIRNTGNEARKRRPATNSNANKKSLINYNATENRDVVLSGLMWDREE
jgi:hypothetical protein